MGMLLVVMADEAGGSWSCGPPSTPSVISWSSILKKGGGDGWMFADFSVRRDLNHSVTCKEVEEDGFCDSRHNSSL